jgi:hypothetical protein
VSPYTSPLCARRQTPDDSFHFVASSKFGNNVPHGVYSPLTTFYEDNKEQDLDLATYQEHVKFVASAGVGIVCLGSMGEAVQLTHQERNQVVEAARQALDSDNNLSKIPLIVGTGASSTKETIELTREAAERGADFAMVITPGYFAGALHKEALKTFFVDVAEASPIPVSFRVSSSLFKLFLRLRFLGLTIPFELCPRIDHSVQLSVEDYGCLCRLEENVRADSFTFVNLRSRSYWRNRHGQRSHH